MILADTSIWIDHMRFPDATFSSFLSKGLILLHPFVFGELAMGTLARRETTLAGLHCLDRCSVAYDEEVLAFLGRHALHGRGLNYIDAHLLVAVRLTNECRLWTRDKRLQDAAEELDLAWIEPRPS